MAADTTPQPPRETPLQPSAAPAGGPPPFPADLQAANASKEARTWAMIGHLAALLGFIGPLIVWLIKREESRFIAFHAKQAMWLQIFVAIACFVLALLFFLVIPVFLIPLLAAGSLAYAIYGAIQVSGGKDFEYYWVGPWVRRTMM
jgi:hypothetical protein